MHQLNSNTEQSLKSQLKAKYTAFLDNLKVVAVLAMDRLIRNVNLHLKG